MMLFDRLFDGRIDRAALVVESLTFSKLRVTRFTGEYWTSKQRQATSLHEVSYRACFKPQLPRFFIETLTHPGDVLYDPFMGRGTTVVEGALFGRKVIGNDINPLSKILTEPRLHPPSVEQVERRLARIKIERRSKSSTDLSMFYHPRTESEILALRQYLARRASVRKEDHIDRWIRMVATNRLTGHSRGFFSVYTLPPNQAASRENQRKINKARRQKPEYRNVKELILRKTKSLLRNISDDQLERVSTAGESALLLTGGAWSTSRIRDNSVDLVVTSPPFLDTVNYAQDNWLRCWFNHIDHK
ncbi:MAG: DNA methyltransferase, partial [Ignavibacteriales bacterium]|nr:DNA methyltransferase [Ignavibacteriales bacterium]